MVRQNSESEDVADFTSINTGLKELHLSKLCRPSELYNCFLDGDTLIRCNCTFPADSVKTVTFSEELCSSSYKSVDDSLVSDPGFIELTYVAVCNTNDKTSSTDIMTYPFQCSDIFEASLLKCCKVTKDGAKKDKYAITLKMHTELDNVLPGDSFYFICPNSRSEVDWLLRRLKVAHIADRTCFLNIKANKVGSSRILASLAHLPRGLTTLRNLFTNVVDIRRVFSKVLFKKLSAFCESDDEKKCLLNFTKPENRVIFDQLIIKQHLSILDILHAFPSCCPPVELLLELLPRLLPRPLSISSKTVSNDGRFRFLFSLVQIKEGQGRFYRRKGVCTGYLTDLPLQSKIRLYLKTPTKFRLELNDYESYLMIGPGVGVAPFVSYLENVSTASLTCDKQRQTWLFFGCRDEANDFILREKMEDFAKRNKLRRLLVSFSASSHSVEDRPENQTPKGDQIIQSTGYVQDNILAHGKEIAALLDTSKRTKIFVCGDANCMIQDVKRAFVQVLTEFGGRSEAESFELLKKMEQDGLYLQEAWA